METVVKMMRKRVFIDMDGVLCEYRLDVAVEDMKQRGFFRLLRPREETVSAVRAFIARDLADVYILSSVFPETQTESTAEKTPGSMNFFPKFCRITAFSPFAEKAKPTRWKIFPPTIS